MTVQETGQPDPVEIILDELTMLRRHASQFHLVFGIEDCMASTIPLVVNGIFRLKRGTQVRALIPQMFVTNNPHDSRTPVPTTLRVGQVLTNGGDELLYTMCLRGFYYITRIDLDEENQVHRIYATQQTEGIQEVLGGMDIIIEQAISCSKLADKLIAA